MQTQPSLVRTLASQLRESRLWPRNPSTVSPRLNSLLFWGLCVTIISSSQLPYDNLREGPRSWRLSPECGRSSPNGPLLCTPESEGHRLLARLGQRAPTRHRTSPKTDPLHSTLAIARPRQLLPRVEDGLWTKIRSTLALSAQCQCTSAVSGELVRPGRRPE